MNAEISCITNKGKTTLNKWEMMALTFFELFAVYIKH